MHEEFQLYGCVVHSNAVGFITTGRLNAQLVRRVVPTTERWLRVDDWGVGKPSVGCVIAQLTPLSNAGPPRSVRVDITSGCVVSGIAEGTRLFFERWGQSRRSGTVSPQTAARGR
jgi:hypothetical protein